MTDMLYFATATYSLKKAAYRIMIAVAAFFAYDVPVHAPTGILAAG